MNAHHFAYMNGREQSATVEGMGKDFKINGDRRGASLPDIAPLTVSEGEKFLRIVAKTSRIRRHYDLFQLLQGEEIQYFIPHQVLISAWGDFRGRNLELDVISAVQGVRTGRLGSCGDGIGQMLKDIFARWVAGGRRPLLLDNTEAEPITKSTCRCALHLTMRRMRSVQVHGFRNERDELDSLYVALNPVSIKSGPGVGRYFFLVESLIAQVDMAFRKVVALKPATSAARRRTSPKSDNLSAREQEIIQWITEGKTNAEIAGLLGISAYTVKNHAQRVFRKLGATNRTEAAARYRQEILLGEMQTKLRNPAHERRFPSEHRHLRRW
jgi:transcriptional regulator EpsA